jgi:hypothetical protein
MNIQKKKIIAKEIIYLFTLFLCVGITFIISEIRNSYFNNKRDQIVNEMYKCENRLNILFEKNLPLELTKQLQDNLTTMNGNGASADDVRKYTKDFNDKFGEKAVLDQISKEEDYKNNLINQIKKIDSSYINNSINFGFTMNFAIILLIILYPLRFIYLIIRWSFRILKQKTPQ